MHTILGANGIIGEELAKALKENYSDNIRLVGRNPNNVNPNDKLFKADLLNPKSTLEAIKGTKIAYLTVGLPYKSSVWIKDWLIVMENVIAACKQEVCKLVYFDNTYAYPQNLSFQNEQTPMTSNGMKGKGKGLAANRLLKAIADEEVEAVICRAPEFYGPGITKSFTNAMVFDNLKNGKTPQVFLNDQVLRTLIYTPDASKAMALIGNTPDTYGQTWHLPCDDNRLNYEAFIEEISKQLGRPIKYKVLRSFILKLAAFWNPFLKETKELFPRYMVDNIFESGKFKDRFPSFKVTTYQEGIRNILKHKAIV